MIRISMESLAQIMNDNVNKDVEVYIDECWEDKGAGMKWTTIIVKGPKGSYQALSPRQHRQVESGTFQFDEIEQLVITANELVSAL